MNLNYLRPIYLYLNSRVEQKKKVHGQGKVWEEE